MINGKPKIVFLYQYFRHPGEPGGTRVYWLSKKLVEEGYHVTVITQKNSFNEENKKAPFIQRVDIDGIEVLYIKNAYANNFSKGKRIFSYLKFMFLSIWFTLLERKVDLVIATSTPITIGLPALLNKWLKGVPFIFEIRDLWPEVPIQMGAIRNKLMIKILRRFERMLYKQARFVMALSPGMAEGVKLHVPAEKVQVIPNMAKIDKFYNRPKNLEFERKLGLSPTSFKIIHFGTMGPVNGLENFRDTVLLARELGHLDIEFILVGSGLMKERFLKEKQEKNMDNFFIFDRMPMNEVSELVNLCDVSYVGVRPVPILATNSANKFFDSLSAGKPIILNYGGWMEEIIVKENIGFSVHPTDATDFLNGILRLKNNPVLCQEMCKNSRRLAETKYDKSILGQQYFERVQQVLNRN